MTATLRVDFGFTAGQLTLDNRVWLDRNYNGMLDNSETPITNAQVSLNADANNEGIPDAPAIRRPRRPTPTATTCLHSSRGGATSLP